MAGEGEPAGFAIHAEEGDIVRALIAAIKELTSRIEIEAAWIVSARPFFRDEGQVPCARDGEDGNAVVQTIACIEEAAIAGEHDLRAEIAAGEPGRQAGNGLSRRQAPVPGVVVQKNDVRGFLLKGVTPAAIRVK